MFRTAWTAAPFSKSSVNDSFHFNIKTSGKPTYIDFQLRPQDSEHLKLPMQTWDWPDDYEGTMKDLDKSADDVQVAPMLELSLSQAPNQAEVDEYGIVIEAGQTSSWSGLVTMGGLGSENAGGGAAIADINGNGKPDLLLMGIDNPAGANSFQYKIGWDLNASGSATSWSSVVTVGGLGSENSGGGAAIVDINGNGKPDLLLMGIDNPAGANSFQYKIGWDLGASGSVTSWSGVFTVTGLGSENAGGGAAIADINGNGRPDLLLMGIDNLEGADSFQYKIGWDLDASGSATSWSGVVTVGGLGDYNSGGGAEIADINGNGQPDLLADGRRATWGGKPVLL